MQRCCSSAPPLPGSRPSSHPPDTLPRALVPRASPLTPACTPQSLPQGTRPGQLPHDTFPDKALPPSLALLISSPSHLAEAYWRRWGLSCTLDQASCGWRSPRGETSGKGPLGLRCLFHFCLCSFWTPGRSPNFYLPQCPHLQNEELAQTEWIQ